VEEFLNAPDELSLLGFSTHIPYKDNKRYDESTLKFFSLVCPVAEKLDFPVTLHWANTDGILRLIGSGTFTPPLGYCTNPNANIQWMVRPGAIIYTSTSETPFLLKPVMSWYTFISHIQPLPAGSDVGYGHTKLLRDSIVAVLPVGWSDGYPYPLVKDANGTILANVYINGTYYPILTEPSMNMITIDITDSPDKDSVTLGSRVQLLGDEIPISLLGKWTPAGGSRITVYVGKARNDDIDWELDCWIESAPCKILPGPSNTPPDGYFHWWIVLVGCIGGFSLSLILMGIFKLVTLKKGDYEPLK